MFTDEQLEAAVRALSEPARFEGAERLVAAAAPQLQRILGEALNEGGWFGEAHAMQVRAAAGEADESERTARIEALIAEETRMAMLIGVAVGWELARELGISGSCAAGRAGRFAEDENDSDDVSDPSGGT
jgi:hypothetical protein